MSKIDLLIRRIKNLAGSKQDLSDSAIKAVVRNAAFFLDLLEGRKPDPFPELPLDARISYYLGKQERGIIDRFTDEERKAIVWDRITTARVISDAIRSILDEAPKVKSYKTTLGRNLDRYRNECGWSYDDLEHWTDISKKLILGHINKGANAHPKTLKKYADAFTKQLRRPVTVADLLE